MTCRGDEITMVRLAGAIVHGAPLDTSVTGAFVGVPAEKLDAGDLVYRVARGDLQDLGIERGDLLIVQPRPDGQAATAELVLALLHECVFVGRWWTKRGRRMLLDHALSPVAEHPDLRVLGAITVVVRESYSGGRKQP